LLAASFAKPEELGDNEIAIGTCSTGPTDCETPSEMGLLTSPSIHFVRWRIFIVFDCHDVAGFGSVIEMQLDPTSLKLPQHILDSPID
jgi:hypothetical protein